ncbi:MAG: hypothetical protein KDD82_14470 [Planctomycetes bacterium]|nr:hypothetical protein [Planctomycetota bacterium]
MSQRLKRLEETARVLRDRLQSLSSETPPPHRRPMHDVAVAAVRGQLSEVGRELARLAA